MYYHVKKYIVDKKIEIKVKVALFFLNAIKSQDLYDSIRRQRHICIKGRDIYIYMYIYIYIYTLLLCLVHTPPSSRD